MAHILTMCDVCAKHYSEVFAVKPYPGNPTTQKKDCCEICKRKFRPELTRQYVVSGKRSQQ